MQVVIYYYSDAYEHTTVPVIEDDNGKVVYYGSQIDSGHSSSHINQVRLSMMRACVEYKINANLSGSVSTWGKTVYKGTP